METNNFGNDATNWVWGVFYYNKNDVRVFPPKRQFAMWWTVNFANWKSVLALWVAITFFFCVIWIIEVNR